MQFNIKFLLKDDTSATTQDVIQNRSIFQQPFMELYNLSCTIQLCSSSVTWEIEDKFGHYDYEDYHYGTNNQKKMVEILEMNRIDGQRKTPCNSRTIPQPSFPQNTFKNQPH